MAATTDRPDSASDAVREYTEAAVAPNTARARKSDWKVFAAWCERDGVNPLPASPQTVAAFLAAQSKGSAGRRARAVSTVLRYGRNIDVEHRRRGFPAPGRDEAVAAVLRGMRRIRGIRPERKKAALTLSLIEKAIPTGGDPISIRDRALLLFGFATGMRRSEIVAIDAVDLTWCAEGAIVELRHSKTDQFGEGRQVALPRVDGDPLCPVAAVREWLSFLGETDGPLFRGLKRGGRPRANRMNEREVGIIVKRASARAGFDVKKFGGHSLRAGYITTAHERGIDWPTIMEQTGHKTLSVAKAYSQYSPGIFKATRAADVFKRREPRGAK